MRVLKVLGVLRILGALGVLAFGATAHAQIPQPSERLTFTQAVDRAVARNPNTMIAAAAVLRADALLAQARSATLPQVNGNVTTTTLNSGVNFDDITVTPRNSVLGAIDARVGVYTPARWAVRAQALDARGVAELSADEARRQTALATADAFLAIIARRQVVEANRRARDTAQAHFDLATQQLQQGIGSRVNQLRAQQELSTDLGLVEASELLLYRAQEALGVLVVADGPVDAMDEPSFDVPSESEQIDDPAALLLTRRDLKLFTGDVKLAERVLKDSSKDRLPILDAIFQPQVTYPSPFFTTTSSWRFLFQAAIPVRQRFPIRPEARTSSVARRLAGDARGRRDLGQVRSAGGAPGDCVGAARGRKRQGRRQPGAAGRGNRDVQFSRGRGDEHRSHRRGASCARRRQRGRRRGARAQDCAPRSADRSRPFPLEPGPRTSYVT